MATKFNNSNGSCCFCKNPATKEAFNKDKIIHVCESCYNRKYYFEDGKTELIYINYKNSQYVIGINL